MMRMPPVKSSYFPLLGGLNLLTPAISLDPGKLFDAQNYEPEIDGGYRRIDGYERFDGHTSPSLATYSVCTIVQTGVIAVGNTITGSTSAATAKVLAISGTMLVLGRVTGTFVIENFTIAATLRGNITVVPVQSGATTSSDDADYALLAANDLRTDILVVPGSGRIRGVAVYNDIVYAFRDNAGATAGAMYKQSAAGWVLVPFGTEVQFSAGLAAGSALAVGNTINGATSGATATVVAILLRAGGWGTAGVGTIIITPVSGSFTNAESIRIGVTAIATSASASTAITRAVGGQVETVNYNFSGSTNTLKMYGADGVNLAFEFDGTNYIPIRTGMTTDTPNHIIGHRNYLFMSFRGSIQFSGITNPYAWTAVLGSGEISTGESCTGFLVQGGNASGSALVIFTSSKTSVLYGTSAGVFNLVPSTFDLGYAGYTMQSVGNTSFGLTARGIQNLTTTQAYGDFNYAAVSHEIQLLMTAKRGLETVSTTLKNKDQYRLYFNDNTAIAIGLSPDHSTGILPLNYGRVVRCITTANLSTGVEVTYFGSDDGYVYQDNMGTSFDGAVIEAWARLPFNHCKSPRILKRFRRVVFEVKVMAYAQVSVSYDLGYGNPSVTPSNPSAAVLIGGGAYWDQGTWDQFTFDAQIISNATLQLTGTEKNISFLFYSSRAQDKSHTLQGLTISYTPQREART